MVDEIWLRSRFHPRVFVSNLGRVRGSRGNIRKPQISDRGYLRVQFGGRMWRVHRLVADAFHGHVPDDMTVNHRDGDKFNNCADNLEIVTHAENMKHAGAIGLMRSKSKGRANPHALGEKNPGAKLTPEAALAIRRRLDQGEGPTVLAAAYGVSVPTVSNIKARRIWRHL